MGGVRIPYTIPFPPPLIYPPTATSLPAAAVALNKFLSAPSSSATLVLTGAGISVESGLPDYRGEKGTYRLNKNYRPIFYREFISSHEARKRYVIFVRARLASEILVWSAKRFINTRYNVSHSRYWARSFVGWPITENARPNKAHQAIAQLGKLGLVQGIITQSKQAEPCGSLNL